MKEITQAVQCKNAASVLETLNYYIRPILSLLLCLGHIFQVHKVATGPPLVNVSKHTEFAVVGLISISGWLKYGDDIMKWSC